MVGNGHLRGCLCLGTDVAKGVVQEKDNYMAIYLNDFIFRSSDEESKLLSLERRTCFESYYPMNIFPSKGLGRVVFDPVTIFYGGNGSGKEIFSSGEDLGVLSEENSRSMI